MKKKISVSISEYVLKEMVGKTKNVSGRIEKLIIRGYHALKTEKLLASIKHKEVKNE